LSPPSVDWQLSEIHRWVLSLSSIRCGLAFVSSTQTIYPLQVNLQYLQSI